MKLRYFIGTLILGLGLAVACDEEKPEVLSEIKVSESYLHIDVNGGSATLQFTASDAWQIDAESLGEWLTADPMSGAAGDATVILSADAATSTRNADVLILCAGKTQHINVIQYAQKVDPVIMTVAEALKVIWDNCPADDQSHDVAGEYYFKGIVCKINEISPQYGNATFYLSDDGKFVDGQWIQVYRGMWLDGAKFTTGDEFSVGDVLTVKGQLMSYKGTPETKEKTASVVAIEKSLISVEDLDFEKLPATDTTFTLVVTAKESPLLISSDSDWLQIVDVNKDGSYKLHADENIRTAERTATISISGPTARKTVDITQKGVEASGSTVSEIIVAADNDQVQTIADKTTAVAKTTKGIVVSDGTNAIYVYGDKVAEVELGDNVRIAAKKTTYNGVPELTDITEVFVDSKGNSVVYPDAVDITAGAGSYSATKAEYIKLTGTLKVSGNYYNLQLDDFADGSKQGSIVYPVDELNANSFNEKKITVTGYFNGLSSAGKYINIVATRIVEFVDNPKGTLSNPYSPSDIIAVMSSGTKIEDNVYIKGIISNTTKYNYGPTYNNACFWISDDGTYYNDLSKDFEAYSIFWLGGSIENPTAAADIKGNFAVGDEVVLYGQVTSFTDKNTGAVTYETAKQKAKIYSINKAETDANGLGNKDYPFNTAGAFSYIDVTQGEIEAAKAEGLSGDALPKVRDVYVKGKVSKVVYSYTQNAGTDKNDGMATFWTSDDGTYFNDKTKDFEAYGVYYLGNKKWEKDKNSDVAVGDDVVLYGQLTKYTSSSGASTYETSSKKAYIYSHNGKTE